MSSIIPGWFRELDLGDDAERTQQRLKAASALVKNAGNDEAEAMVRIAFQSKQKASDAVAKRLIESITTADATNDVQPGDRQLELLCGAALLVLFAQGGQSGARAALAVTTTGFGGARAARLPTDLAAEAERALIRISDSERTRPKLQMPDIKLESLKFDAAAQKVREAANNWENVAAAFGLAADATRKQMASLAAAASSTLQNVGKFISIQDEELQCLWWLVGEQSWDMKCPFGAVATDAQPIIFAKELAALTDSLPGPRAVTALLSRAGVKEKRKLTVPVAVNAADLAWLREIMQDVDPSPVTNPIHFAMKRKLETGDDHAWVANWAAVTEIDAAFSLNALALADLFYRERLLLTLPRKK